MHYQKELKTFVTLYAILNEKDEYVPKEGVTREALETDFITHLSKALTENGLGNIPIKKNANSLRLIVHPDRKNFYTKEVAWLESYLTKEGEYPGVLFKLLDFCTERLIATKDERVQSFQHIEKIDDLLHYFEKLQSNSVTFSQRQLYGSFIACIKEYKEYKLDVDQAQSQLLKVILQALPFFCAGPMISIFYTELTALYGFYLCACTVGSGMKKTNMDMVGTPLLQLGLFAGNTASIVIIRMLEISLWASHKGYNSALNCGQLLLKYVNSSPKLLKDNSEASFQTGELKLLASAFEEYLHKNAQQYFREYRPGTSKRAAVLEFMSTLQTIDKKQTTLQDKLVIVKTELEKIASNKTVNTPNGELASTIQKSFDVLELLLIYPEGMVNNSQLSGAFTFS